MNRRTPPLYLALRKTLLDEFAAGKYPVGTRFPTEQELCERFGYARHTVREALRALQDAGLIRRQARNGTTVLATKPAEFYKSRVDSVDALWQYSKRTRFEPQSEGILTLRPALAKTLGRTAGERWLRLAGYRRLKEEAPPLCWSEIFIAEAYRDIRPKIDDAPTPIYALLCEQFGLTVGEIELQMTAVPMPKGVATALGVLAGSPALVERRTYFDSQKQVFEISISLHPGDRFAHTTSLVRDTAAAAHPSDLQAQD